MRGVRLDHQLDHILVDDPMIKLVRPYVTGTDPNKRIGGLWPRTTAEW